MSIVKAMENLILYKKSGYQSRYMLYQKWYPVMVRMKGLEPIQYCYH